MRVLIVGAGISGLAAARGLLAAGHTVTVLERAPALRDGGCAIVLWCNGTAILGDLGVRLEGAGVRISAVEVASAGGRPVMAVDAGRLEARFGAPVMGIRRRSLHARLAEGLPDEIFRFGAGFTRLHDDGDSVRAETEDGTEYSGDLLLGRHGDIGLNPAGDRLLQWFFNVAGCPGDGTDRPDHTLALLRERSTNWAAPVRELLAALSADDLEYFPHHRQRVARRWGHGRCVLIGDAVHAMPPNLAQGAGQALEDVAALLDALADTGGPSRTGLATALRTYEKSRRRRAKLASALASRSVATGGPRTLFQTETALRANAMPDSLATRMFELLLRRASGRL